MNTGTENADDFDFEIEGEVIENTPVPEAEKPEIEVEDDTPESDRGREPMPKEIVDELEADELEEYSEKVKIRLKQMKKVWHDERREKERALREQQEALAAAQRYRQQAEQLRATLSQGEQSLLDSYKKTAEYETEVARREYREAYESGDADKLIAAQEKLNLATYRAQQLNQYKPTLQDEVSEVQSEVEAVQPPRPDTKTMAWQERNTWYGSDAEMTAAALGLHQKLVTERGPQYAGSDEYWATIDTTMRRRFPEYFGESDKPVEATPEARTKPAPVVAPASRSRSPKKIVLKQSQVAIAKKLGLTPEQYVRELMKLEN